MADFANSKIVRKKDTFFQRKWRKTKNSFKKRTSASNTFNRKVISKRECFEDFEFPHASGLTEEHERIISIRDDSKPKPSTTRSRNRRSSKWYDELKRNHRSENVESELRSHRQDDYEHRRSSSYENGRFKNTEIDNENYDDVENSFVNYGDKNDDLSREIACLQEQLAVLKQENEELTTNLQTAIPLNPNSEVTIFIHNDALRERFQPSLEEIASDIISEKIALEKLQEFCIREKNKECLEAYKKLPEDALFSLDNSTKELQESALAPKYFSSFSEDPAKINQDELKNDGVCTICHENHSWRECPHKSYHNKNGSIKKIRPIPASSASGRYHVLNEKQSKFKPGVISLDLRHAMGLCSNQLPIFMYHMRLLDYPPGWLMEAKVESSGITLYGLDGNADGVATNKDGSQAEQFDPDKIIDFPGFNCPVMPNFYDEHLALGLPPLLDHQQKTVMIQNMIKNNVCLKRKRTSDTSSPSKPAKVQKTDDDMDIDDDTGTGFIEVMPPPSQDNSPAPPSPPKDNLPAPPPPPPPEDDIESPSLPPLPPPEEDENMDEIIELIDSDDENGETKTPSKVPEKEVVKHTMTNAPQSIDMTLKQLKAMKDKLLAELQQVQNISSDDDDVISVSSENSSIVEVSVASTSKAAGNRTNSSIQSSTSKVHTPYSQAISPQRKKSSSHSAATKMQSDESQLNAMDTKVQPVASSSKAAIQMTENCARTGVAEAPSQALLPGKNKCENSTNPGALAEFSQAQSHPNFTTPECPATSSQAQKKKSHITSGNMSSPEVSASSSQATLQRSYSQSKSMTLGTPVLSGHSSYSKLPDYENFSKNVTEHMNFENIPNSTGAYSKIKNVIRKVKAKFSSV